MYLSHLEHYFVAMAGNIEDEDMDVRAKPANCVYMARNATSHWVFELIFPGWVHLYLSSFKYWRKNYTLFSGCYQADNL